MVNARLIRLAGAATACLYAAFIVWVYINQPRTMAQVAGGVASTVGAYRIDQTSFDEGLRSFRGDRFPDARAAFERADPAQHDPRTQFYLAYSYYRQGFGRVYNDDALFRKGLEAVNRALAVSAGQVVVDDPTLGMRSAAELKAELERGLTTELDDLNPLKVFRARK
jgi:hypothetical protein